MLDKKKPPPARGPLSSRRLSSKQNERMMIEHASRCVFVFYDLLKLLCELSLFKLFKHLKLRNNLHA